MSVHKLYDEKVAVISYVIFGLCCVAAQASVIDLRQAILSETNLIHYYTFESPREDADTLRREDRAGTSSLEMVTRNGASAGTYTAAFDSLSMGCSPTYVSNAFTTGSAWQTTNEIALPPTMTIECLCRPNLIPFNDTYVLGTRDANFNRGYYLRQTTGGNFEICIGTALTYWTIVDNYATGHWYYVVSTYSVSGGKTTINSYYADLTVGGELQHTIVNEVVNGHYGSSAVLGVGCLALGSAQYFAPCTIDEVAFYDTVFDADTLNHHLKELKLPIPIVEYREIFPCDGITTTRHLPQEGWQVHRGTNAIHMTFGPVIEKAGTAFDEDVEALASFPQYTGVTNGYLNNHSGATDTNYFYWTEEMTNLVDISWLKLVQFDARFGAARDISFAVRVDTNSTPANTDDDPWFYALDFDGPSGFSAISIPAIDSWHRYWFEPGAGEWAVLDFEPGARLIPGDTQVALPTNGMITAFGLFEELHVHKKNERFDNVTLYTRRVYPPPPPQGTVLMIL